jgi:hydrogenase nickel incorporation protein HypA/HybF
MHEMSLAEGIVQLVEDAARADGCTKVTSVWLEIGQLAAVETESLRFCFDAVTHGSIAEGARLKCEGNVPVTVLYDPCPVCGSHQIQVTGGSEMRVKEFEVE